MLEVSNCSPEMAVPITVKMPEPMTAPMPRAVSDQGPSVFFNAFSGSSDSRMSLSMDLQASSWLGSAVLLECRAFCEVRSLARGFALQARRLMPQCT